MARKLMVEIVGDASSLENAFSRGSSATGGFGSALGKVAKITAGLFAAKEIVGFGKDVVEAAIKGQASQAKLEAALKATNQSVERMTPSLERAQAASRKLGFTNEESRSALAKLEVATGSTRKSVADLSVAEDIARFKHTDLTNASQMLAMAMTGSQRAAKQLGITVIPLTTNMDALKKAHVDLSTAAGKQAEAHAKLLDKMATGNAVIDTVSQKLHGQADAYASTAAGGMAQFHAQLDDLKEKMGNALLPVMERVLAWVNAHWPQISAVVTAVFHAIGVAIDFVKPYIADVIALSGRVVSYVKDHWPQISAEVTKAMNTIRAIISGVVTAAQALWEKFGGRITAIARTAFETVKTVIKNDLQAVAGVFTLIGDLIHGRWSKLWGDLVNIVSHELAAMWAIIKGAAAIAGGLLVAAGRALIQGFVHGIESMFDSVKHTLGNLTSKLTSWKGPPAKDLMLLFSSGQLVIKGFQMGMESEYPAVKKSLQSFTEAIAADAYRGAAAAIQRVQEAISGSTSNRVTTHSSAPTQYRNANGDPLSDAWVQQQIDASLSANPDASTGAYQGPPMGDQYGTAAPAVSITVNGWVGNEAALATKVRDALVAHIGKPNGTIFGRLA